jgi:prolipoprotein diacylglyceryltransferase
MFYGIFRFAHECFRDTPRLVGGLSGYHLLAMGILLLGLVRYVQRARVPTSNLV